MNKIDIAKLKAELLSEIDHLKQTLEIYSNTVWSSVENSKIKEIIPEHKLYEAVMDYLKTKTENDINIQDLKNQMMNGWSTANAITNDRSCSKGFEAADKYIRYLENELEKVKDGWIPIPENELEKIKNGQIPELKKDDKPCVNNNLEEKWIDELISNEGDWINPVLIKKTK